VKVSNRKGIANQTGPESCVAHREVRDEALTGEPAGQPLSRESFKLVQGADAVSVAEGNMDRRDSASAYPTLRGLRTWHVGTLFARELGDLLLDRQEYASFNRSIVTWCNKAVNRSFFLCFATSRTRSGPWDTLPRLGVRLVRCSPVFPSAPSLRSADPAPLPQRSTSAISGFFADLFATMEGSDFSCSFFIGFDIAAREPKRSGPN
jgi:hypothetical protein